MGPWRNLHTTLMFRAVLNSAAVRYTARHQVRSIMVAAGNENPQFVATDTFKYMPKGVVKEGREELAVRARATDAAQLPDVAAQRCVHQRRVGAGEDRQDAESDQCVDVQLTPR